MTISQEAAVPQKTASLRLHEVTAGYGRTSVLHGVSVAVDQGSVTALIGPNGAGKTTLLRTASGLLRPTSGIVELGGHDVTHHSPDARARAGLCLIPEGRGVYRRLTVRENLMMQVSKRDRGQAVERALTAFPQLGTRLDLAAGSLSGGQQQMLSLCAAYVRRPSVIVVDEPSLGLAPIVVDEVFEFLGKLAEEMVGLLIVDQFVERVLRLADHAYVMHRGEIAFSGPAAELRDADTFAMYMGDHRGAEDGPAA
jgi:branched-chain amino acid transport system ATP-binding protein